MTVSLFESFGKPDRAFFHPITLSMTCRTYIDKRPPPHHPRTHPRVETGCITLAGAPFGYSFILSPVRRTHVTVVIILFLNGGGGAEQQRAVSLPRSCINEYAAGTLLSLVLTPYSAAGGGQANTHTHTPYLRMRTSGRQFTGVRSLSPVLRRGASSVPASPCQGGPSQPAPRNPSPGSAFQCFAILCAMIVLFLCSRHK